MSTAPADAPRTDAPRTDDPVRARLAVVPARRTATSRLPFVTLVSLMLLGGVVGLLCFNTQMQQASFAQTELQSRAATLAARQQSLHDQVQALRDPQHLAHAAQRAGMVVPQTACTVRIGTGLTTGECGPATDVNTPPLDPRAPTRPASIDPAPQVTIVQAPPVDPVVTATSTETRHHHRRHR